MRTTIVLLPGLLATLLIGSEVINVAFLAGSAELASYPWGSGLGWAYQSKYHYLASGLLWIAVAWVPYISVKIRQRVMQRAGK